MILLLATILKLEVLPFFLLVEARIPLTYEKGYVPSFCTVYDTCVSVRSDVIGNVRVWREEQPEKASYPIFVTLSGIRTFVRRL